MLKFLSSFQTIVFYSQIFLRVSWFVAFDLLQAMIVSFFGWWVGAFSDYFREHFWKFGHELLVALWRRLRRWRDFKFRAILFLVRELALLNLIIVLLLRDFGVNFFELNLYVDIWAFTNFIQFQVIYFWDLKDWKRQNTVMVQTYQSPVRIYKHPFEL